MIVALLTPVVEAVVCVLDGRGVAVVMDVLIVVDVLGDALADEADVSETDEALFDPVL